MMLIVSLLVLAFALLSAPALFAYHIPNPPPSESSTSDSDYPIPTAQDNLLLASPHQDNQAARVARGKMSYLNTLISYHELYGTWQSTNGDQNQQGYSTLRYIKEYNSYEDSFDMVLCLYNGFYTNTNYSCVTFSEYIPFMPASSFDEENTTINFKQVTVHVAQGLNNKINQLGKECSMNCSVYFTDKNTGAPFVPSYDEDADKSAFNLQFSMQSTDCGINIMTNPMSQEDNVAQSKILGYSTVMNIAAVIQCFLCYTFAKLFEKKKELCQRISQGTLRMITSFDLFLETPISLVLRNIQAFSKTENIESLAIEPSSDLYLSFQKEEFSNLYSTGYHQRISGHATTKGTKYYSLRSQIVDPSHFRTSYHDNLTISSVGVGTYVGEPTEVDDLKMFNGITESVETGGVNIIDTAINYRYQKSERVVGAALRHLLKQGYSRDEFFICSKNGYIPEDAEKGISNESIISNLIEKGKLTQADVIKERFGNTPIHCIHPAFLEDQLERTLTNIGVETLDLYYLHNPAESQLPQVGRDEFYDRLAKAFEFCEKKAEEGKIRSYGLATWACFRAKHTETDLCLRLQEVVETAKKVAGDKHRFRYIQLPFNLLMPEAFLEKWQEVKEGDKITRETLFQVAKAQKINVITSSPLAQGLMSQVPLSSDIFKANNLGAKHLQFSRSVPAQALLSTLVGQKTARHTKKNLEVIQYPPLNDEEWLEFFKPSIRRPKPEEAVEMDE